MITLILILAFSNAAKSETVRMQCEGSYSSYLQKPVVGDVPISGIYIEISEDQVRILGGAGFDSTYSIVARIETGIGFELASDRSYGGFLNRLTGQLSLMQQGPAQSDGSFKIMQSLDAKCTKAKPLF